MDQCTAQRQLLLHPAGELPGFPFPEGFDLDIYVTDQVIVSRTVVLNTVAKKFRFSSTVRS